MRRVLSSSVDNLGVVHAFVNKTQVVIGRHRHDGPVRGPDGAKQKAADGRRFSEDLSNRTDESKEQPQAENLPAISLRELGAALEARPGTCELDDAGRRSDVPHRQKDQSW